MTDDFRNAIANQFPANGQVAKQPPALPKKAPPPLPPKKSPVVDPVASLTTMQPAADAADRLRAIAAQMPGWTENVEPVIEKGYCNPPDSPAVLAATPEEAARVQGIEAPKAPEPDLLDEMTRTQLIEECNRLGVEVPKGARETRLRKDIRAKLAELAAKGVTAPCALPREQFVLADVDEYKLELPTEPAARQEALDAIADESRRGGHVFVEIDPGDAQATLEMFQKIEAAQQAEQEMKIVSTSIGMLFVNCDVVGERGGRVLSQAEMVRKGNAMIKEQSGVEDYRLVQYGQGAGYLSLAVKDAIESGAFGQFEAAAIDTRTPEGQTLYSTLAAMAGFIVRAV